MKIEFIKRGAETRLILLFAGWSTDTRYYSDCVFDGWDTALLTDYSAMEMPPIPEQYTTIYIFAFSLGVAAAARCRVAAAARIAICGSPVPVSDEFGIPEDIYKGTAEGLTKRSLMKFHIRMAGDKTTYETIRERLEPDPDIDRLKHELAAIMEFCSDGLGENNEYFDRVYLAEKDRIFPFDNMMAFWSRQSGTSIVKLEAPHAVDIASIIRDCLPDTVAIGEGFQRAEKSYNEHASIQQEICRKIAERLEERLPPEKRDGCVVLEIGPGQGLLTEEWRKILRPRFATYVDLTDVPCFGIADGETYLQADAERWLEHASETFDVILSASTIQWFADPIRFVSTVRRHLNPGGIALISTFVKGNLYQLDALRPSPILYRTAQEYADTPGRILDQWKRTLRFQSLREMKIHISLTGVSPRRKGSISLSKAPGNGFKQKSNSDSPIELTYCPLILFIEADASPSIANL